MLTYYNILSICYVLALALWWLSATIILGKAKGEIGTISRPWLKVVGVLVCGILTILVGRLYSANWLVPEITIGSLQLSEVLNQVLIYSPFLFYFLITREPVSSAFLPKERWLSRLTVGLSIAILTMSLFVWLANSNNFFDVYRNVFHLKNTHHFVQVFLEDFAIAILLSRLSIAMRAHYLNFAILFVSLLFAFGHLPSNLESGVPLVDAITNLLKDSVLVFLVCFTILRFKDLLWFFPIHFVMDMMQFYSGVHP